MMTAGEINKFVFYSVNKCLFKQNCIFFKVKIYLKRINKGVLGVSSVLGCPLVCWGNKTDPIRDTHIQEKY